MNEEEIKQLQIDLLNTQKELEKCQNSINELSTLKDSLTQENTELKNSINEYRDINSKLALRVSSSATNPTQGQEQEHDEPSISFDDIINKL